MALIHVYNGISEEKTTYTFNGRLRDNIELDWNNTIVLKGGREISPDYELRPEDIIFIRKVPTSAAVAGVIVLVTALVFAGIAAGITLNNEMQAALETAQKAQKAASEQVQRLPYVRGARNQIATGQTFPFVIGETLYTPLQLCTPHYTIEGARGEKQYFNIVLESGYNNLLIKRLNMGDNVIKIFDDTEPQAGVYNWDAGTYYDENNIIEIQQSDAFTTEDFNKKIALTELNKEIPHQHLPDNATSDEAAQIQAEWENGVVQQLASNPQEVEIIALFDGLQKYDNEAGSWGPTSITLRPQWTNNPDDTEPTWHDFDTGFIQNETESNTFTYNTRQQMRYSARQQFTAAQAFNKKISIRVIRTTPKADSNARDTVYLMAVQTTCYDPKKSSTTNLVPAQVLEARERSQNCRIGIRVTANANTNGMLNAFSVIVAGQAATWNGTEWGEKTSTRNLAAWVREILITDKHAPSRYDPEELDPDSWGAWYDYCELMGFHADGVITKGVKKETIINTLCRNGNAALVLNPMTGLIEVAIDNGRDYSIALLNSDTVQTISTTKEFKRKPTGKKVTYINRAANYDIDSVIFMRDGGAYDPAEDTLTTTALEYITDYEHAFKYAWRQMAEESAQPRLITVKVGPEAAYYPLFSRVELQHASLKIGLSHVQIKALTWQNGLLKKITLDGPVTFPASGACGILVYCVNDTGRGLLPIKVDGTGKTDELTVLDTISATAAIIPSAGNFASFGKLDENGEFSKVTKTMKIINAEESDTGYILTLVDYNPALYEYGELPTYKTNITQTPESSGRTIEEQREFVQPADLQATASEAAGAAVGGAVQAAVDTITNGYRFTNIYNVRPVPDTLEEIIAKMDSDAGNASAAISISEEEILIKVEDLDAKQRAFIDLTKDEILEEVDDMARELTGLIDIQAGAVSAIVAGGGAAGQMSLSLNLPVTITAEKRAELITASSEEKVNAVYGSIENTNYYGIKPNASNTEIKALWDDLIAAGELASQIVLSADQINIAGKTIYTSSKTAELAEAAQAAAEETAAADAAEKASAEQEAAEDTAEENRQALIAALSKDPTAGHTVIDGGYIKTGLIDTAAIKAAAGFFEDITITGTLSNVGGSFVGGLGKKTDLGAPWESAQGGYNYTPLGDISILIIQKVNSHYGVDITTLFVGVIYRSDIVSGEEIYHSYDFTILQQSAELTLTPNTDGTIRIEVSQPSAPSYTAYYATELSLN